MFLYLHASGVLEEDTLKKMVKITEKNSQIGGKINGR
jgi:hypothetical protein